MLRMTLFSSHNLIFPRNRLSCRYDEIECHVMDMIKRMWLLCHAAPKTLLGPTVSRQMDGSFWPHILASFVSKLEFAALKSVLYNKTSQWTLTVFQHFVNTSTEITDKFVQDQVSSNELKIHETTYTRLYWNWKLWLEAVSLTTYKQLLEHEMSCNWKTRSYRAYTYVCTEVSFYFSLLNRGPNVSWNALYIACVVRDISKFH